MYMMLVPRRNNFDLFDDFFNDAFRDDKYCMRTDIKEHDDSYELITDLPGFSKDDINLSIENGYLNITAKTNGNSSDEEKGKYVRRERYYGEMSRSFYIGENVEEEDVKASFKNGILSVVVPKVNNQEINRKKQIEIED